MEELSPLTLHFKNHCHLHQMECLMTPSLRRFGGTLAAHQLMRHDMFLGKTISIVRGKGDTALPRGVGQFRIRRDAAPRSVKESHIRKTDC